MVQVHFTYVLKANSSVRKHQICNPFQQAKEDTKNFRWKKNLHLFATHDLLMAKEQDMLQQH